MVRYPDQVSRRLAAAVREPLDRDAVGELISREVASSVPHEAMNLVGLNPCTGTISFGFWHRYPPDLARAVMLNCYWGDDPMRPVDLARQRVPIAMACAAPECVPEGSSIVPTAAVRTRGILREHGAGCELRLLLRDRRYTWGVLCLFRESGRRPFAAQDADRLMALAPALIAGLRSYVQAGRSLPAKPPPRPGVILVGADHTVRGITAEAREWLGELRAAGVSEWLSSPDWSAVALASEGGSAVSARPRERPVVCVPATHAGRWVALHAQSLGPYGTEPRRERSGPRGRGAEPMPKQAPGSGDGTAVVVQAATGGLLMPAFAAWYGLTPRERQVVEHFAQARTCRQVAAELGISPFTVNDYLKTIFRKTRVRGRDELMALLNHSL
ncbi:helix-turn-helix transcriptional regulator [Streptomyces sp. NPDC058284]|uniref:helix-turn-helix transcriptional regulator n=1 Tax=unclassified Streptomyces TaxID=2593676 RepID=UPI00365F90B5